MAFTLEQVGEVLLVAVDGQLVVTNRQDFKQQVIERIDAGARKLVIDFAHAAYVDSSGLGVLVSLAKRVREAGGQLRLSGLNEDLRVLFELTRLDSLFQIVGSRADAIASF
ncbi:MAG: STAS domain-containing protein [Gemmatimonadaceae bacterium]|jgi:anti-anti-sigma factor|nr:STAS domain-containing protein [Gemmatimonadaceae bacterium]